MRVLLIDNQPHVRTAIQFLLDQQPGISVVGTADTSDVLPERANILRPDIVLISWDLWRKSATDLFSALHALDISPRVLVFGSRLEVEQAALQSGADAFLCVYDPPEKFLNVLRDLGDTAQHANGGLASET
jgi:DNA-binding NarL/FixJ family response regulator